MRSFPAGLYRDVGEEVVAFVRNANNPQLVLGTGDHPRPSSVSGIRALSEDGACRSSARSRQTEPCSAGSLARRRPGLSASLSAG